MRLINLTDILENNYVQQKGDCIQVIILWRSELPKKDTERKICRFIFGDGKGCHITGILFLNYGKNTNALNVVNKLQGKDQHGQWKFSNFQVQNNVPEHWRILREQTKRIILSSSTCDVNQIITDQNELPLKKYIPFQFTELEQVDACTEGQIIDLIGYVSDISKVHITNFGKHQFKRLTIKSSRSTNPNKVVFQREISLFGDYVMNQAKRKNAVYALLNVHVGERQCRDGRIKSLKTTSNTLILKISEEQLINLPPWYRQEEFVVKLFPKKRTSSVNVGCRNNKPFPTFAAGHEPSIPPNSEPPYSPPEDHSGYYTAEYVLNTVMSERQQEYPAIAAPSHSNGNRVQQNGQFSPLARSFSRSGSPIRYQSVSPPKRVKLFRKGISVEDFPVKEYNFIENYKPLEVHNNTVRSTHFMDDDENSYQMRSNPRGMALIVNNYLFKEKRLDDQERIREGSHKDVEYLHEILKIFKFDVDIKENVSVEELPGILANFKSRATKNMDACFVAIFSHGLHGLVEMVDSKLVRLPNDIVHQFDKTAFPKMEGKPKIFLFQTCQDIPSEADASQIQAIMADRDGDVELENMIECYAAASGTSAGRDPFLGSHFIYVFVDTLMDHAHDTDLLTILKVVQVRLQKIRRVSTQSPNCEWKCHRFNKDLYFNPGL